MTDIERLRYYEREYLRSFDFEAEQRYHMEMRRRLNLALHLQGIVDGLELLMDTAAGVTSISVTAGMAIDAYGREIVLFAPYTLSEEDIVRITVPGEYSVWAAYSRAPSRPPAATHRICNLEDQFTRWTESAKIIVANGIGRNPLDAPGPAATLSDDPERNPWPVLLGSVQIDQDSVTSACSSLMLRRLKASANISSATHKGSSRPAPDYKTLPTDASLPISAESDLQATKNLIVGQDFAVTGKIEPPPDSTKFPDPTKFPGPSGNLRAQYLFLEGDLYRKIGNDWLGLGEQLKRFMPEVRFGHVDANIPATAVANQSNGSEKFDVSSTKLASVSKADIVAFIAGVTWNEKSKVDAIMTKVGNTGQAIFGVTGEILPVGPSSVYHVELKWNVGPIASFSATDFQSPILKLSIAYAVVFSP